jgi:membrane-associated phospholipid phosphatase
MKTFSRVLSIALLVCLLAGYAWAGTIMVGEPRPPISPALVKVYMERPRHSDRIAIITKGSGGSWAFDDQSDIDRAIEKIRVEAARLGANGIFLQAVETHSSGGIGIGIGGFGFPSRHVAVGGSTSFYAPIMHKTVQAEAIWVRR